MYKNTNGKVEKFHSTENNGWKKQIQNKLKDIIFGESIQHDHCIQ